MGICAICKKTSEEVKLYSGILATEMVNVCEECAEDQKIPIIRKPSESQLNQADKTYSVKERLDKMSGKRDTFQISSDQMITQNNLAKLRAPPKTQHHEDVLDNYYWTLKMSRRRTKMTASQLAKKISTTPLVIQKIEKGILPEDFKEVFLKLEALLGIKLLKAHQPQISFTRRNRDKEQEILKAVEEKIKHPKSKENSLDTLEEIPSPEPIPKPHKSKHIEPQQIKFSKREDLQNITIDDLIDRKRAREKYKMKIKQNEIMGDDIDIEEL